MIWFYLLLLLAGIVLAVRLAVRRSRHLGTAAGGTLLAALAILGGFSIGIYLAAVAAVLLIVAGSSVRRGAP